MSRPSTAVLILLFLLAIPAAGTVLVSMGLPELVRAADEGIVHGRVLSVSSDWNESGSAIFTHADVVVIEDHAGKRRPGETMTFRVPGGRIGDEILLVPGAPVFRTGEEVLVFASTWSDGPLMVVGYEQGLARVRVGSSGSRELVDGSVSGMPLESFRGAVRELLRIRETP
jgi:hypothetical protein